MKFKHSLMSNNFTKSDMNEIKKFINHKNIKVTKKLHKKLRDNCKTAHDNAKPANSRKQ